MKNVAIIGFGRFGKTLYRLIKNDFKITIYDNNKSSLNDLSNKSKVLVTSRLDEVFINEVIFYCVPINKFETIINSHKKHFRSNNLLIDVLSVKVHPKLVLENTLNNLETQALLTHPMFGPDSSKGGFDGLPIVLDKFKSNDKNYLFWKSYFESKKLNIMELSAEKHDKLTAKSQAMAHFIGRGLESTNHKKTKIDTKGAGLLSELIDLTTNDSMELFNDLQNYNPYAKSARNKLLNSLTKINEDLTK